MLDDEKHDYYSSDDDNDDGFIMLTDDGGIQKKIILPGDDDKHMTPPKNARVKCHYIGKLIATGQQFDTSRVWGKTKKGKVVRPAPLEFILGQNKVIKALDVSIGTMTKNEICIIRCSPAYGYGEKGKSNDNKRGLYIPGNAWLEFEIELLGWHKWQYINNNKDLQKQVIVNGYKAYMAKPDDLICLSFKAHLPCNNNAIFDAKERINIICDDDMRFPDGFHLALQGMQEGELSVINVSDHKLAYGAEGNIDFNIPYFADIQYEIHIHHIQIVKF